MKSAAKIFFKNFEFSSEELSTGETKSVLKLIHNSLRMPFEFLQNSAAVYSEKLKYMQSVLSIQLNINFSGQNFVFKNSSFLSPIAS